MVTNPNPNIIRLAKIMNLNPNIRDLEEKIRIRIRIFVTTLKWAENGKKQDIHFHELYF